MIKSFALALGAGLLSWSCDAVSAAPQPAVRPNGAGPQVRVGAVEKLVAARIGADDP